MTVDSTGNAYVTGETGDGFFISSGALNQAVTFRYSDNYYDIFVAKFSPAGSLVYSALLGTADPQGPGGGPIGASAISVDAAGDAYVTGQAGTHWPITNGAYLSKVAGAEPFATPFVMKVAPDAKSVIYSTYLDYAYDTTGISVVPNGDVFVVGNTASATYPTTPGAYKKNNGTGIQSFLTELNESGSALVYSTMVCDQWCNVNGMAIDPKGNIWLALETIDTQFSLALPMQSILPSSTTRVGPVPALSEFDPTGETLEFSTFLGSLAPGYASGVAIDPSLRVHVSGGTEYGMYTTGGVYAASIPVPGAYASSTYAFVDLVDPTVPAAGLCVSPNTGLNFAKDRAVEEKLTITSCGAEPLSITGAFTTLSDFSVPATLNGCLRTLPVGQSCAMYVSVPVAAQSEVATLVIASNAPIPAMVPLNAPGTIAPIITLSANSLTFGPQLVATESAPQTITLTNTGNATLNGVAFGVQSTYGPIFPFTYSCGPSLIPGASCTFSIAFKPASTGTTTTTLQVENNSGLASPQVSLSGTSPAFTIVAQAGGSMTSTVTAGSTSTYALAIASAAGYSGNFNLSCGSVPANASCTFAPASLAVTGGTPANFTLSVATELNLTGELLRTGELGAALAGFLFLMPLKWNRRRAKALICSGAILLVTSLSACGGGSSGASGPQTAKVASGSYTIQVAASDASGNRTTQSMTLIVQ